MAFGYRFLTASASTCEHVCLYACFPASESKVRMLTSASLSTTVLRSQTSPSTSPTQAALARPSLMSFAMSMIDIGEAYSFLLPSFSVIIILRTPFISGRKLKNPFRHSNCQKGRIHSYSWFHPSSGASAPALFEAFNAARRAVLVPLGGGVQNAPYWNDLTIHPSLKALKRTYCPRHRFNNEICYHRM